MPPFNGECRTPEQKVGQGIVILASKRGHGPHQKPDQLEEGATVAKRSRHGPNQVFRCEEAAKGASNFPVGAGKLNCGYSIIAKLFFYAEHFLKVWDV